MRVPTCWPRSASLKWQHWCTDNHWKYFKYCKQSFAFKTVLHNQKSHCRNASDLERCSFILLFYYEQQAKSLQNQILWHAVVNFIIVTGSRTRPPVAVGSGGGGLEGEVGWSTAPAKGTSKAQTVELSSQCKLSASVCSGLNTVAAYYNTSNPGTPASAKCIIALNRCWCWRSLSVYFTVITRAYDALSQHAHSCSVVKWENLSALKTLKAPSVSSPEPTHCLCTIYKHKRRRRNRIHLAPKNLCFSSPRFWQKPRFPVPVRFLSQH